MEAFIGTILPWPISYAPSGWMLCQGQLLAVSQYQALYALIGNTYGGTAPTTFGLPDLRSRIPLGAGAGPNLTARNPGQTGGAEDIQIGIGNLPSHTHAASFTPSGGASAILQASTKQGDSTDPSGNFLGNAFFTGNSQGDPGPGPLASFVTPAAATGTLQNLQGLSITGPSGNVIVGNTGDGMPVSTLPPFLALNYIMCVEGIWPSRP